MGFLVMIVFINVVIIVCLIFYVINNWDSVLEDVSWDILVVIVVKVICVVMF